MRKRPIQLSLLTVVILMLVTGAMLPLYVRLYNLVNHRLMNLMIALIVAAFVTLFGLVITWQFAVFFDAWLNSRKKNVP